MIRSVWYLLQPVLGAIVHYYIKDYMSLSTFLRLYTVYWLLLLFVLDKYILKLDKYLRLKLRIDHESGLSGKEWARRQEKLARQKEEQKRMEELEAQLQSRHHTDAEIDYLIRTSQLWESDKKHLREKYLGKKPS